MTKDSLRSTILAAKQAQGLSWEDLAAEIGCAPVFLCAACLGEHSLTAEQAAALAELLGLDQAVAAELTTCQVKGSRAESLMNDPLVYRFREITLVYGEAIKQVIHEKFGDGIMSAIDFTLDIDKIEDPKGDRVKVTMNGKFLPYKRW